jgi:hypothetical protein
MREQLVCVSNWQFVPPRRAAGRSLLALHRPLPPEVPLSAGKARRREADGPFSMLPVCVTLCVTDRLREILVLLPALAEEAFLMWAVRANVAWADARLLVTGPLPTDRFEKPSGRFQEGRPAGGVLRKRSGYSARVVRRVAKSLRRNKSPRRNEDLDDLCHQVLLPELLRRALGTGGQRLAQVLLSRRFFLVSTRSPNDRDRTRVFRAGEPL